MSQLRKSGSTYKAATAYTNSKVYRLQWIVIPSPLLYRWRAFIYRKFENQYLDDGMLNNFSWRLDKESQTSSTEFPTAVWKTHGWCNSVFQNALLWQITLEKWHVFRNLLSANFCSLSYIENPQPQTINQTFQELWNELPVSRISSSTFWENLAQPYWSQGVNYVRPGKYSDFFA